MSEAPVVASTYKCNSAGTAQKKLERRRRREGGGGGEEAMLYILESGYAVDLFFSSEF